MKHDKRTAAEIALSNHLSPDHFSRTSALRFLAGCPRTMSPFTRVVGLVLREGNAEYLSVHDIALLVNASDARVLKAIGELNTAGLVGEWGR